MLFLLRKIRKSLIEKNKLTTYLLYAAGEIILVVVGILVAVNIDNWNESKNERKKELSYLNSYASDIQKNIAELERVIKKSGTIHRTADTLIHRFSRNQSTSQPALDSMTLILGEYTLYLSQEGTTQNLLGAGSLEIIQNVRIRTSFVTQEADQKRIREVEKGVFGIFNEYIDYLKQHTKMHHYTLGRIILDKQTELKLMSDDYFINILDDMSYRYKSLQDHYKKRKQELEDLLVIVESESSNLE
ncbi:MAG: hypothetical protein HRT61_13065 [Ekhidna sp.]|nr:hypothetical protein [Ekhidna sp.]